MRELLGGPEEGYENSKREKNFVRKVKEVKLHKMYHFE